MCSKCFTKYPSKNKFHDLCHSCNEKRLTEKGNRKKRKRIKYKPKETGELKVFAEIWNTRKHECEHCGIPIREAKAENFSHRKPKSTHPELRLQESNVDLLCGDCHDAYGNRGKQVFENRKDLNEGILIKDSINKKVGRRGKGMCVYSLAVSGQLEMFG